MIFRSGPARVVAPLAALLLLGGCTGGGTATPSPGPPSGPAPIPTVTAAPSASPRPSATPARTPTTSPTPVVGRFTPIPAPADAQGTNEVPADLGSVPEGFALPHEDEAATEENTAYEPASWYTSCLDEALLVPALEQLEASRIRQQVIPEGANGEGLLVFATDADATAFVDQLSSGYAACAATDAPDEGYRNQLASSPQPAPGEGALTIRTWTEYSEDGSTWVEAPGGSYDLLARKGRYVALAFTGGEFVGDPATTLEADNPVLATVEAILAQV